MIPGSGGSLGKENGNPLQYSYLENLVGYSPWGLEELDRTEWLTQLCPHYTLAILLPRAPGTHHSTVSTNSTPLVFDLM